MRVNPAVGAVALLSLCAGCGGQEDTRAARVERAQSIPLALGPEIGTDVPSLTQKDLGWNPALASDGSGFLATYTIDDRVRAVRVDATGNVLDPIWLALSGNQRSQLYPDAAFGADRYLVVWTEPDPGTDPDDPDATSSVRGRFVSSEGVLEGDTSFPLSTGDALYSTVAWTGTHFLVAWVALAGDMSNVRSVLVDTTGARVDGSERALSTSGRAAEPRAVASADQLFVAWTEWSRTETQESRSQVFGTRVGLDGSPKDAGGVALSADGGADYSVEVASDGAGFLAVWHAQGETRTVRGSVVRADGSISARDIEISDPTRSGGLPSIVFDGSRYLVAWADDADDRPILGVRVSTSGVVEGSAVALAEGSSRAGSTGSDRTTLAFNGQDFLVAFVGNGVEGSLVSAGLQIEDGSIGLTALPNAQGYPHTTWTGSNYLVGWVNELESFDQSSVRAVRISPQGVVLEPMGLAVSGNDTAFSVSAASSGNGTALLAWAESGDARTHWIRRVPASGPLGAPVELPSIESSSGPTLAANGSGYLAVIDDSAKQKVIGLLLDADGSAGAPIEIASSAFNVGSTVHAAGDGYLVSYGGPGTRLAPVSALGAVGTPLTLSEELAFVRVATNGADSLVVWADTQDAVISARRYADGAWSGEAFVLTERSAGFGADVAWDGSHYLAAWDLADYTIEGRTIGADGTLGEIVRLAQAEASGPVLASDGNGQLLLSYVRWFERAQTRRVTSRLVGRGAQGTPSAGAGGGSHASAGAGGEDAATGGVSSGMGGAPAGGTSNAGSGGTVAAAGLGASGAVAVSGTAGSSGAMGNEAPDCSVPGPNDGRPRDLIWAAIAIVAWVRRGRRARAA